MYGPAVRLFAEESSGSAAYGAVRTIRANEPQRQRGSAEVIPRGTLRFAIEIDPGRGSASHLSFVTRSQEMEMTMHQSGDLPGTVELDYEQWREAVRPDWGLYTPNDPKVFVGRVRPRSIFGFNAADVSNNA